MKTSKFTSRSRKHGMDEDKKNNIAMGVTICGLVLLALFCVFVVSPWFAAKPEGGQKSFSFESSLITGKIQKVDTSLINNVKALVKKGTAVNVNFAVENGDSTYVDSWEITEDDFAETKQPQERTRLFKKYESLLNASILAYNNALTAQPFRSFVLGVDVTEGYVEDQFHFSDYFSPEDMDWLTDSSKSFSLAMYSIGYNPIPGCVSWKKDDSKNIEDMQMTIQDFLSNVPDPLDETALFAQIHFILGHLHTKNSTVVIQTDLMENTEDLSAYRGDSSYLKFVAQDPAYMDSYQKQSLLSAEIKRIDKTIHCSVHFTFPKDFNTVLGRDKFTQKWYNAVELYLHRAYPKCNIQMPYVQRILSKKH